jgi:peroxiredoxin
MAELREVGVQVVAFVSVNDAFVMDAWGRDTTHFAPSAQECGILMLADPEGDLMRAMG